MLYNMDQTPIEAEMPQNTTIASTGAKDARIATGGEDAAMFHLAQKITFEKNNTALVRRRRRIRKSTVIRRPRRNIHS